MMDGERKINLSEGVPLNSTGAANIFLNTGKNTKVNSPNGTVIHLKSEKSSPADVGLHINTTFSIASSKKIKLLFILNFLLSVICMIISCSVAFYYWNEMSTMRRQLDTIKEQIIIQKLKEEGFTQKRVEAGALISFSKKRQLDREPRMEVLKDELSPTARTLYVEDLGEDMLLVDLSKKGINRDKVSPDEIKPLLTQRDLQVAHFNGALREVNLGTKTIIGPWSRDNEVSSKKSGDFVELHRDYVTIKEGGLYLVYAQVSYLTHAPNCYFLWARQNETDEKPRLLSTCSTGDDSTTRPLDKSQISCAVQTVARLFKNDIVNLVQREHNRTMWLRPGYSYFGFIKLSS